MYLMYNRNMRTRQAGMRNMYLKWLGVNIGDQSTLFSYFMSSAYLSLRTMSKAYAYSRLLWATVRF
jgi:hypothetical protein